MNTIFFQKLYAVNGNENIRSIKRKNMLCFNFSLLILFLLIQFDVGESQTDMKNNSTTVPTLCKFIYDIDLPLSRNLMHMSKIVCLQKSL